MLQTKIIINSNNLFTNSQQPECVTMGQYVVFNKFLNFWHNKTIWNNSNIHISWETSFDIFSIHYSVEFLIKIHNRYINRIVMWSHSHVKYTNYINTTVLLNTYIYSNKVNGLYINIYILIFHNVHY